MFKSCTQQPSATPSLEDEESAGSWKKLVCAACVLTSIGRQRSTPEWALSIVREELLQASASFKGCLEPQYSVVVRESTSKSKAQRGQEEPFIYLLACMLTWSRRLVPQKEPGVIRKLLRESSAQFVLVYLVGIG
ncbi:hypothetical protein K443DRAFT_337367 [Laccaria amethystina LaAM-08-1]|jgi:hypothetical protein|uniref:Uncharacterized protein n=1 Tax=Laccaria amethystina LaAM-08-1 TaxID=1095629 RepID=A0A0C9WJS1_9AGAR|nr:hypothetical protein K443DRAFT_337367 [Laccaria amethystina LaAM-08-1]